MPRHKIRKSNRKAAKTVDSGTSAGGSSKAKIKPKLTWAKREPNRLSDRQLPHTKGPVKAVYAVEAANARVLIWQDADGKKLLVELAGSGGKENSGLTDVLRAVSNKKREGLSDSPPVEIIIDPGLNHSAESLQRELDRFLEEFDTAAKPRISILPEPTSKLAPRARVDNLKDDAGSDGESAKRRRKEKGKARAGSGDSSGSDDSGQADEARAGQHRRRPSRRNEEKIGSGRRDDSDDDSDNGGDRAEDQAVSESLLDRLGTGFEQLDQALVANSRNRTHNRNYRQIRQLLQELSELQKRPAADRAAINESLKKLHRIKQLLPGARSTHLRRSKRVARNDAIDRLTVAIERADNTIKRLEQSNEGHTKRILEKLFHALKSEEDQAIRLEDDDKLEDDIYDLLGREDIWNSPYSGPALDRDAMSKSIFSAQNREKDFIREKKRRFLDDGLDDSRAQAKAEADFATYDRHEPNDSERRAELDRALRAGGDYFFITNRSDSNKPVDGRLILNFKSQEESRLFAEYIAAGWEDSKKRADWRDAVDQAKFYASDQRGNDLKYDKMVIYVRASNENMNDVIAGVKAYLADQPSGPDGVLNPDISAFYQKVRPGIGRGVEADGPESFTELRAKELRQFLITHWKTYKNRSAEAFAQAAYDYVMNLQKTPQRSSR